MNMQIRMTNVATIIRKLTRNVLLIRLSFLICFLAILAIRSYADVTITVKQGSTSTCLGSLYQQVLVPEGWGASTDTNLATTYARSDVGVLGITLYLEIRPNSTWPNPGNQAMNAIVFSFLNTHLSSNITPASYSTFKSQIKYQSAAWTRQQDGSGDLVSSGNTTLVNALNASPTSGDCLGLMYSFAMAQSFVNYYYSGVSAAAGHTPLYSINVEPLNANPTSQEIFFNSTGSLPAVLSSRKVNLFSVGNYAAPSGKLMYFWGISDAKLLNPPYPKFY